MSRVLLVEAQNDVAQKLKCWFLNEGCTVDLANNRSEALQYLLPQTYDFVMLDYPNSGKFAEFYKQLLVLGGKAMILVLPAFGSASRANLIRVLNEHVSKLLDQVTTDQIKESDVQPRESSVEPLIK